MKNQSFEIAAGMAATFLIALILLALVVVIATVYRYCADQIRAHASKRRQIIATRRADEEKFR